MEPITLGFLFLAGVSGVVGNRADYLFCSQVKALWSAFRDGSDSSPGGELTVVIRRAQLLALKLGVESYRMTMDAPRKLGDSKSRFRSKIGAIRHDMRVEIWDRRTQNRLGLLCHH